MVPRTKTPFKEINGYEIGKNPKYLYILVLCPDCKKERWILKSNYIRETRPHTGQCRLCRCHSMRNENHPGWKGGKRFDDGYLLIKLPDDDRFFLPMVNDDCCIREHRLVMAKHLGRCLQSWEIVHHKNGNKIDNRLENLELTSMGSHSLLHSKGYKDGYDKGLTDGKDTQIKSLRLKIKELEERLNDKGS